MTSQVVARLKILDCGVFFKGYVEMYLRLSIPSRKRDDSNAAQLQLRSIFKFSLCFDNTHLRNMDDHRNSTIVAATKLIVANNMERKEATWMTGSSRLRIRGLGC